MTPDSLYVLSSDDVNDVKTFVRYAQQAMGAPIPRTNNDWNMIRKKAKEFFEEKPGADWQTLCRVVQWARMKKKRPSAVWKIIDMWKWAWEDGALPELDPQ